MFFSLLDYFDKEIWGRENQNKSNRIFPWGTYRDYLMSMHVQEQRDFFFLVGAILWHT